MAVVLAADRGVWTGSTELGTDTVVPRPCR